MLVRSNKHTGLLIVDIMIQNSIRWRGRCLLWPWTSEHCSLLTHQLSPRQHPSYSELLHDKSITECSHLLIYTSTKELSQNVGLLEEREIIVTLSAIESKLLHDKSILFSPNWFLSIGPYISSEKFIKILGRGKSKVCLSWTWTCAGLGLTTNWAPDNKELPHDKSTSENFHLFGLYFDQNHPLGSLSKYWIILVNLNLCRAWVADHQLSPRQQQASALSPIHMTPQTHLSPLRR